MSTVLSILLSFCFSTESTFCLHLTRSEPGMDLFCCVFLLFLSFLFYFCIILTAVSFSTNIQHQLNFPDTCGTYITDDWIHIQQLMDL